MARVRSVSRIHVTLIDLNGSLGRVDGSVGVTLDEPAMIVDVEVTDGGNDVEVIGVEGDTARKAEETARLIAEDLGVDGGITVRFEGNYPEHVGLGSGTQTALSVATALHVEVTGETPNPRELALKLGRGGTSGIGVAAFEAGGFIVDGGHRFGPGGKEDFRPSAASKGVPPAPVVSRLPVPEDWRFVLAIPDVRKGAHGKEEVDIFRRYCPVPSRDVERLCRLVLMAMMPAVAEDDIETFGRAVDEVQLLGFKRVEVGLQHPLVRELMETARTVGAYGAGLSSFGPTVYAVCDTSNADTVARELRSVMDDRNAGGEVLVSRPRNEGAEVEGGAG